jgi:hypothetical protein
VICGGNKPPHNDSLKYIGTISISPMMPATRYTRDGLQLNAFREEICSELAGITHKGNNVHSMRDYG